jgi:hypothetical protein
MRRTASATVPNPIRVRNGVYREAVMVNGSKKRFLRLIGNPGHPEKVLLRARGNMQNGIFVNAANEVTVNGFMARDYKSNGFFFTNLTGYTMNHLIARRTGVYGLYAFNTIGGRMINSEAYYVNDGAFTSARRRRSRPVRHDGAQRRRLGQLDRLQRHQHAHVTITKSRFYNNALGIVPNALTRRYLPAEDNVIIDNDILLEQLQLPQGSPAVHRPQGGHGRDGAGRHRRLLLGGRGTGSRTTGFTATT